MTIALPHSVLAPNNKDDGDFGASIITGLREPQKRIESKWLYDAHGSRLFDRITELDEYYPTRIEAEILRQQAVDLRRFAAEGSALIELGSGSSTKTRLLLDALPELKTYVPIDISESHLRSAANRLSRNYRNLRIHPLVGDFTCKVVLPPQLQETAKILFFPGSTIGNFTVQEAGKLLASLRGIKNVSAFVIGFDLIKNVETLIRAYDDAERVTAKFNINLLRRINRELGADFDLSAFHHQARWNAAQSRIEMHLVSSTAQQVHILGEEFLFSEAETIHTENSHKFSAERFVGLATAAGWHSDAIWMDADKLFGVAVLTPHNSRHVTD